MASKRTSASYPHLNHLLEAMAAGAGVKVTPVSRRAYPENATLLEDQAGRLLQDELSALAGNDAAAWGAIAKARSCPDLVGWVTQAHGALAKAQAAKAQAGAKGGETPAKPAKAPQAAKPAKAPQAAKPAKPAAEDGSTGEDASPAAGSAKLDEAIEQVMAAMPDHGGRMNYADMKTVLGWPTGYYNITKLARTLEERGLATQAKREDDKLRHWEAVVQAPAKGKGKAPAKGKGKAPAKAAACK